MSDLHDPTREALADAVTSLVGRHGGPTKVARLVSADRTRVHAWMKGDISLDRLGQLAYALDEPVTVRFGPDTEIEPPEPTWVGRLQAKVDEIYERQSTVGQKLAADVIQALTGEEARIVVQRIASRLAVPQPPSAEESADLRDTATLDTESPAGRESS